MSRAEWLLLAALALTAAYVSHAEYELRKGSFVYPCKADEYITGIDENGKAMGCAKPPGAITSGVST